MESRTNWEALSELAQQDRRRCKRVQLAFPIELSGLDPSGRMFNERTVTRNVSAAGCSFHANTQLRPGDVVAVKLLNRQEEQPLETKPVLFQIVWAAREGRGWLAGACMLQPVDLWQVAFPSDNQPGSSSP